MQIIKLKKPCPYCKEFKVIRKGKYFVNSKPHWIRRYACVNCKKTFNLFKLFNRHHVMGWDNKIYRQVKKLINKRGYFSSKYDNRRDKTFLSSRAIMKIVKRRTLRGNAVSSPSVCKLIKRYRVEV